MARLPSACRALGGGLCRAVVCAWGPGEDTLSHRRSPVPHPVLLALLGAVLGTAVVSRAAGPRASCGGPLPTASQHLGAQGGRGHTRGMAPPE